MCKGGEGDSFLPTHTDSPIKFHHQLQNSRPALKLSPHRHNLQDYTRWRREADFKVEEAALGAEEVEAALGALEVRSGRGNNFGVRDPNDSKVAVAINNPTDLLLQC